MAGATPAELQGPVPFHDAGNPVMAQLAFLATMLSPRIAAAAAQRALEVGTSPAFLIRARPHRTKVLSYAG